VPNPEITAIRALLASRPRPPDIAERRARMNMLGDLGPLPDDVRTESVSANGVPAEWSQVPTSSPDRVLMYMHGGGYLSGSIISHRLLVTATGRAAGVRTLALDYRRGPEHRFPAALEDVLAAYRFLLAQGIHPNRVVIGGDSAGGGLTVAGLCAIRDAGLPLPAAGWCISPWVDLRMTGATIATKAAVDPLIQLDYLRELADGYLGGADPDDPRASPLRANLRGLPPLLIQVGTDETLLDDAVRLAGVAAQANVRVRLETWPEMIHAWHIFHPILADGRAAIRQAGAFIRAAISLG
jgi:epsilon-lactone hydrolase